MDDDRHGKDGRRGGGRRDNDGQRRNSRDARGGHRGNGGGRGGHGRGRNDRNERGGQRGRSGRGGQNRRGGKGHAQRAGRERDRAGLNPQRPGFREERLNNRMNEPEIPSDVDIQDLDPMVLQDLKVLSKQNAEKVAQHLAAAAILMDESPRRALEHARAAKDRAGRVAVTRETNGIAAYRAGEWHEALSELRAARRMSGGPGLLAVMADCERGLGRPERALELARGEDAQKLDHDSAIELAIVAAGARADMGDHDSAVTTIEAAGPDKKAKGPEAARLSYAYADALLSVDRRAEAREWFLAARRQDEFGVTDVEDRLAELDRGGVE
ncbi:hypothetical protein CFRA_06205 [Corynebacterium frankenforstense DSM 45800]|uniref:Tetratricopeptide repeat protein n=1 Tax=Corynebacterium frankenforstense DSM 45800 TaxID=1437875 RepID=A0A1L7CSV4_9CORY|nr:hypothetical protein [Corynebacterium frankenforstense]APT88909.1 hypothetical protein CFRA_06205 [Corynebacterium frankenforstense DSM 45800]